METGEQFDLWTEATIEDSFLDPCQTMSLRVGVDETRFGLVNRLRKGGQFQLLVNGAPQLSGFIDKVAIESSHSGTSVSVSGRDIPEPRGGQPHRPQETCRQEEHQPGRPGQVGLPHRV